jgi:anti-sigma factor RsiW
MKDLKQQLTESDPIAREGGLDAGDAQTIRRRMLAEARSRSSQPRVWWLGPLALAGAVAACLMLAIGIGRRIDNSGAAVSTARPAAAHDKGRTQLQFATTGGTRIIWTFHENLDL